MRTYGSLAIEGDKWRMDAVPPNAIIRLKQLFPRIPKAAAPPYMFPRDLPHATDLSWFLQRYPMEMEPQHAALLRAGRDAHEKRISETETIFALDYEPPAYVGVRDGFVVRKYQAQAVELLMRSQGLLLGDEVGLGKTYMGAAAALQPGALPAIVVCQTHLQGQWKKKVEEFTTLRVHCIRGTKPYKLPDADIYAFRFTQLAGWADAFEAMAPKLVIWDETQELRTGIGTDKGAAAERLAGLCTYRFGLTATPIYGYGAEIYEIMRFIAHGALGDFGDFTREWCFSRGNGKWGITDPKALGSYLRQEHVFLRRTKKDVGQEMEPVNRVVKHVEYDHAKAHSIDELARKLAITATTGAFMERGNAARELDMRVRQITGVAKARGVATLVRMIVESGAPVLLGGWHREVYDIWLDVLHDLNPVMYTGSESPAAKAKALEAFLTGQSDIMIMSLRSGAGVDGLQARCSTAVLGEMDWSPGVHHQFIGRLDREGQADPVTAIFAVTDEGSDPPMIDLLGLKASESTAIIDPDLGVQAVQSDESRLKGLIDQYLRKRAA